MDSWVYGIRGEEFVGYAMSSEEEVKVCSCGVKKKWLVRTD